MTEKQYEEIEQIVNKIYERAEKERLDNQHMENYYKIKEIANNIDPYIISLKDAKEILQYINRGGFNIAKIISENYKK